MTTRIAAHLLSIAELRRETIDGEYVCDAYEKSFGSETHQKASRKLEPGAAENVLNRIFTRSMLHDLS